MSSTSSPRLLLALKAAAGALLTSLSSACTAIVVNDLVATAPCDAPGDCAAGFVCAAGLCEPQENPDGPPAEGTLIDDAGGSVIGPGGTRIDFPSGAVSSPIHVEVRRMSSTFVPPGLTPRSGFFAVVLPSSPDADVDLDAPADISLAVADACDGCAVYQAVDEGPWTALAPTSAPAGAIGGRLTSLNVVVVAGTVEGE